MPNSLVLVLLYIIYFVRSMKNDNLLAQYETIKTTLAVEEASLKVLVDQLEQGYPALLCRLLRVPVLIFICRQRSKN